MASATSESGTAAVHRANRALRTEVAALCSNHFQTPQGFKEFQQ
jgi:hypothetical protein